MQNRKKKVCLAIPENIEKDLWLNEVIKNIFKSASLSFPTESIGQMLVQDIRNCENGLYQYFSDISSVFTGILDPIDKGRCDLRLIFRLHDETGKMLSNFRIERRAAASFDLVFASIAGTILRHVAYLDKLIPSYLVLLLALVLKIEENETKLKGKLCCSQLCLSVTVNGMTLFTLEPQDTIGLENSKIDKTTVDKYDFS